ncbi:MAG: ATP-binding protein [Calditrichaeota bacterium]|nr:ATP-binding protein [Calditrichota bacterium]
MLTKIQIQNFKRFDDISIDLGRTVVFIGPNQMGKTSALQALTLWDLGAKKWIAKRGGKILPKKRPGVTINRKDLIPLPQESTRDLWKNLKVRSHTKNILISIIVEGIDSGQIWRFGMEFDYLNPDIFFCRPINLSEENTESIIPDEIKSKQIVYLQPMSGLMSEEPKIEIGRINVLMGEGQTAQVLRNLCYLLSNKETGDTKWDLLCKDINDLFGIRLNKPVYSIDRGSIDMTYTEKGLRLPLSSSGRGFQQTLLVLSNLYLNPESVLLFDEPDAHLEILRQRKIYSLLSSIAEREKSQIIIASHSEVILNEAAGRDSVVAFLGQPHLIINRTSQVIKSLSEIGWEDYYLAEQTGWILYLEDSTDYEIILNLARILHHPVFSALDNAFVKYVSTNLPQKARDHFFGLREAKPDLRGIAIFDRLDKELHTHSPLVETMWRKREIENYICVPEVLTGYAESDLQDDLFGLQQKKERLEIMRQSLSEVATALQTLKGMDIWSPDIKASDDFLEPLFRIYFSKLNLPLLLRKGNYADLTRYIPEDKIDTEINEKLDLILKVTENRI